MNLCDINDLMSVAAGMNFALIIFNYVPLASQKNGLAYLLNLYSNNSKNRASKRGIISIIGLQNITEKVDYCIKTDDGHSERYELLTSMIEDTEIEIKSIINQFLEKSNSCLTLTYLPHISLFLVMYSIIVLILAPFQAGKATFVENSLLILNVFTLALLFVTFFIEFLKRSIRKIRIGFIHYFFLFAFIIALMIISIFMKDSIIFNNNFVQSLLPLSFFLTVFIPFTAISFYLLRTYLTTEFQFIVFKIKLTRLHLGKTNKLLVDAIDNFEKKVKSHIDEEIAVVVSNGN